MGTSPPISDEPQVQQQLEADQAETKPGWPNLFGPYHNSISPETKLNLAWGDEGPPELWRKKIGTGYSSPVIQENRLVLFHRLDDWEIIDFLDAKTGEQLWEHRYPTAYECQFEYSSGPYSTPILTEDRVFAIGAEGQAHCLKRESGEVIWQRDLKTDFKVAQALFGVGASPLLEGDRLIFNIGGTLPDSGIVALSVEDGRTLWTATNDGPSYCTPVAATIHGRRFVFVLTYEGLVGLDPGDGTVHFQVPFRPTANDTVNATSPLVVGNRVFLAAGPGPGCRLIEIQLDGTPKELWRNRRALDSQFNNLVALNGFVYGYTSKWNGGATFNCVDLETGELQWKFPSDLVRGCSLAVGDHFLLWGEHGHLALMRINPIRPELISMTAHPLLRSPCYSAPALANGLLFLRNEQTLLCLSLRPIGD